MESQKASLKYSSLGFCSKASNKKIVKIFVKGTWIDEACIFFLVFFYDFFLFTFIFVHVHFVYAVLLLLVVPFGVSTASLLLFLYASP